VQKIVIEIVNID